MQRTTGLVALTVACLALAAEVWPSPREGAFRGHIAVSAAQSTPDWPQPVKAPDHAPNVLIILLDDIGFADTGTFGGVADTPELDRLAAQGLRYNNFNTAAMCSPTRAALLTGRNHHRVGFGIIADRASGYPGYDSVWNPATASIAQVLRMNGYSTAAFGKWHNTPDWETTQSGPFDRWPTGLGFEHFYGFLSGQENHWEPTKLYRDTTPVDPPSTPARGYHLTTDITDQAIRWIRMHESFAADKPYFVYFATGAVHAPHHAPAEWIERYRGKFDRGWDWMNASIFARQKQLGVIPANARLTPRPPEIPAWDSLSADQRRLYARQMEVYAAFVAHTDHEIGRLLSAVRTGPQADNTLILYIVGDNGAAGGIGLDGYSAGAPTLQAKLAHIDELGGPDIPLNIYSMGWAWAGDTPFQYWKTIASHFGATRDPMVVSWPTRIHDRGGLRSQFTHANDVAATLYDVIGIRMPTVVQGIAQLPLDGVSFAQTFGDARAPSRHHVQYFEMLGNRAIYRDGWVAAARHQPATHWSSGEERDLSQDRWELYHVDEDFSEAVDLAGRYPDKLHALQRLFDVEARRNQVYPLGFMRPDGKPSLTAGQHTFTYYPDTSRVPDAQIPELGASSYRLSADVIIPATGAEGVLASYGDRAEGFVWYIKDGHLIYETTSNGIRQRLATPAPLPAGRSTLAFELSKPAADGAAPRKTSPAATGRLLVNAQPVAQAELSALLQPRETTMRDSALFIGRAAGSPVSSAFQQPFTFTGTLHWIRLELP